MHSINVISTTQEATTCIFPWHTMLEWPVENNGHENELTFRLRRKAG
jgi:hypothetical protein